MLRNSQTTYGLITVLLHWSMALLIVGLFGLGLWMVDLDYYHTWYHRAPDLHKSLGLLVALLWVLRLLWRCFETLPEPEKSYTAWERRLSLAMHRLFYLMIGIVLLAGYLISTAEQAGISFFGWFEVPALLPEFEQQADLAGWVHWALAWLLIGCAFIHAVAACRHHFYNRDRTLLKMLGRKE
ncbi:MAG: cytochrome b [Pseudomonadales bacterium]